MDFFDSTESAFFAYRILFKAVLLIPISHYACGCLFLFLVWLYNFLEFHFLQDLFSGFRGQPVSLTFNSCSDLYNSVVSKCPTLHGRYLATPWLSSPHIQTAFLNFFGRPPVFSYRRKLFHASDGGTLALDWLLHSDVSGSALDMDNAISNDDEIPLVVVIPGLMSDSASAYIKHLAFDTAKHGWNVVVSNHRGLGGISITSDCFYNAGWTEDVREVIDYLHHEYPKAPLFVVGTSIGANILVKYLGENGEHVPIAGAAAICSPWDLLIGDRFINRKLQQKLYDRALAIGLKEYAELHQPHYTRLADWEGIRKSRSIRDFDNYATCHVGKYETVDTYYRHCSSASFVRSVSLPLLCISALDDPVCTREAIPWDECRANKNVVLATTQHGGHLAFFEGTTAAGLWWVRVVQEFFDVLRSSTLMHRQKKTQNAGEKSPVGSTIDQGPFVNVAEDGLVAAMGSELSMSHVVEDASEPPKKSNDESVQDTKKDGKMTKENFAPVLDAGETSKQPASNQDARPLDISSPIRRCFNLISRQNKTSFWLLVYIAIVTSWPLVGSALRFVFKRRLRNVLLSAPVER